MRIFIDSARIDEIEKAREYGVLDGVTTNPSLIKKAVENLKERGQVVDMDEYIKRLLRAARPFPVSLEVIASHQDGMIAEGLHLFKRFNKVAKNVVIKIPIDPAFKEMDATHFDGVKAIRVLASQGIPINCTLIFTPEQALLAAKAGARYVSPFAGRLDDYIRTTRQAKFDKAEYYPVKGFERKGERWEDNGIVSGVDLVKQIVDLFAAHKFATQVLAASIRNARQVRDVALAGAHIATLPLDVIEKLLHHRKTMEGMEGFTKDIVDEYAKLVRSR
ncbi:MAG: transaldolase family protein [Nanoarchaeota archaeon]